ncbi:hypothetical protein EMMF5_005901 [Cystobasidiomycetes sp. EMM_F5]
MKLSDSVIALSLLTAAAASPLQKRQAVSAPTVTVRNGTIRGALLPGLGVHQFLGVPYAQDTGGQNRFRVPQSLNSAYNGTFDATGLGNVCPGYGVSSYPNVTAGQPYVISENCLNVNIWRPANISANASLPVLFWIFGGGSVQGTNQDPRYNGSYLAQYSAARGTPIIFVGVNYRLAAFGFPGGNAVAAAGSLNLGYKDQRMALRWLQENIAAFGGDPSKVTLWGQSAGGSAVVAQNIAYGGRNDNLFRASIVDSGTSVSGSKSFVNATLTGWNQFLNRTGCSDDLACLRNISFASIYTAANGTGPFSVIDGDFLQDSTTVLIQQGKYVKLPLMLGNNLDEATEGLNAPFGIQTDQDFINAISGSLGSPSNATIQTFLQAYPNNNSLGCPFNTGPNPLPTGAQDKRIRCAPSLGSLHTAITSFKYPRMDPLTWAWLTFTRSPMYVLVFGIMNQTVRNPMSQRPADLALSRQMQSYWINFVVNGDPNIGGGTNGTIWPNYGNNSQAIQFQNDATVAITDNFRNSSISVYTQYQLSRLGL